jgi:NAD(P)-dependent dehydrogenase (short-subunit alcohol dehydrogenase family)
VRLQDKRVIVTGGASGIGRAICELFSQEGAGVVVADIDIEGGGETVSRIEASGRQAPLFVRTDVSSTADLDRLVHESVQFLGGIDILVNNAASFIFGNIENVTRADWNNVLGVNLIGASDAVKYALPYLKKSKAPSIVNIASIGSFLASPDFIPYCSSKGALLQLTRCLAMDLAKYNIRVNCVCPGSIYTPATEKHISFEGADREEFLSSAAHASFLNRVGQPEEVAYAALFLASEESSFITGTPLMVDGGASAK